MSQKFTDRRHLATSTPDTQLNSILIVTATKIEAQAVLEVFSPGRSWTRQLIRKKVYYALGVHGGASVFMVQSETGASTPGGALLTVYQAIEDLQPQSVIMCGIAFGLHPEKQQLGDILVAMQLRYYEPRKEDLQHGQMLRGGRPASSDSLLDRFRSGDNDWQGARVHFGLILSGEKLVNDPTFRDWLLKIEPEAIGGEMEGAGLYAAAHNAKVDWILVKAICDWADGKKNDDAQLLAARNAAQFVRHVLQLGDCPATLPESPLIPSEASERGQVQNDNEEKSDEKTSLKERRIEFISTVIVLITAVIALIAALVPILAPVANPTSTPTLTPTAILTHTPILIPTPTLSPFITTTIVPTPTNIPSPILSGAPAATPYPPLELKSPNGGVLFQEGQEVKLIWEWKGQLEKSEFFEVRIRPQGEQKFGQTSATKLSYYIVPTSHLPRAGSYEWQVAIISLSGEEKGKSQIWSFSIQ